MGTPLLLVENLFSRTQFPLHTVSANEEATNHEAFRVADGRRSPLDYWTPTTANNQAYVYVTSNQITNDNGFESGTGHAGTENASMAQDATQHHSGTKSLKVTTTNVSGSGVYFRSAAASTAAYPVSAGKTYAFSVWAIGPTAVGKTLTLRVLWYDAAGINISVSTNTNFSLTASWVQQNYTLTAPATAVLATPDVVTDSVEGIFDFFLDDVSFGRSFTPDTIFLDRGHNLAGVASVKYQSSNEGTSWTDVQTVTISSVASTDLTATNGASTEEGAWGKTFTGTAGTWHRLLVPAMGTGLRPVVVGLTLGTAYQPSFFYNPFNEDRKSLGGNSTVSEWGWHGNGPRPRIRQGELNLKLADATDYTNARYHLDQLYAAGRPMWTCFDRTQADRTFLSRFPDNGVLDLGFGRDWFPRSGSVPYEEWEPKRP